VEAWWSTQERTTFCHLLTFLRYDVSHIGCFYKSYCLLVVNEYTRHKLFEIIIWYTVRYKIHVLLIWFQYYQLSPEFSMIRNQILQNTFGNWSKQWARASKTHDIGGKAHAGNTTQNIHPPLKQKTRIHIKPHTLFITHTSTS